MALDFFRRHAGGFLAKLLLGLLIIAFGIWGIADVFRGFGAQDVAVVGSSKISVEGFRRVYTERLQQVSRQLGRGISGEQARAMGLDRQILGELIAEYTLDQKAQALGLGISDAVIVARIHENPAFRGPGGGFDPIMFREVIRQNGFTEPDYIATERRLALRRQLAASLGADAVAPAVLRDAVRRYEGEERAIEFVRLGPVQAGAIPNPTPEQIAAYYEANKADFRAPEYRSVVVVTLTPETVAPWVQVSDEDLRAAYESRRERYAAPERREIEQIVFPSVEQAKAAADRIAAGTPFQEIAKERGLDPKDVSLGLLAKRDILDKAVADAAFALEAGKVSAPVAGRFGAVLVRVAKIEPASERPFASLVPELRHELQIERARRSILDLHDKIEDERASGSNLAEVAQKLKLPVLTIDAIDRQGRGPNGAEIEGLPARAQLLPAAFAAAANVDTDPIELRQAGGYVWYEVKKITPARERTLEEARERVETRWRDEEIGKLLAARAEGIRVKLDAGEPFAAAARGLAVDKRAGLKRGQTAEDFDARALGRIFDTAKDKSGITVAEDGVSRIVFRVTAVNLPPPGGTEAEQVNAALARQLQEDLLTQYVVRLQADLGVRVNEAALRQVTGDTGR
jgi:peptidyl-prolyl cis-trans isomerase D